ncbi:hypothetical protein BU15DRAFT_78058 [Melanogaster broomeanus]|nr:hypothetical protein BU15DRAFT_78058 [Melanogaster broomeanus]
MFGHLVSTDIAEDVLKKIVADDIVHVYEGMPSLPRSAAVLAAKSEAIQSALDPAFKDAKPNGGTHLDSDAGVAKTPPPQADTEEKPRKNPKMKSHFWSWKDFQNEPLSDDELVAFLNNIIDHALAIVRPQLGDAKSKPRNRPEDKCHAIPLTYDANREDMQPDFLVMPIEAFLSDRRTVDQKYANFTVLLAVGEPKNKDFRSGLKRIRIRRAHPWVHSVLTMTVTKDKVALYTTTPSYFNTQVHMNRDCDTQPIQVRVNQRALVQKVLARYPEENTVVRELVQNADDAGAGNVEIEFQTKDYATKSFRDKTPNGILHDLTGIKAFKWIVRNDGEKFKKEDWGRLTNIADGNPDDQKIGAFGVGFFSVFSITERLLVISGDHSQRMYYEGDQLMVQLGTCEDSKWTIIEMEVKDEQLDMPTPFDLSRFCCTAVTFLVNVKKVTILLNGQLLSQITKSRTEAQKIPELPKELKRKREFMQVKSVEMIPQEVQVILTPLGHSAGSKKSTAKKPTGFFEIVEKAEPNRAETISRTASTRATTISTVKYRIYSAHISSNPSNDIVSGLEAATKKKPPSTFRYEAVHLTMDQYQQVMQGGSEEGSIGSVFRGVQALYSEVGEGHGSRLFIGQSTAQTSGIAVHLSSRFIPTVERGSIDIANGQVAKWNEELLYIGGFLTRLIYEQTMKDIRERWPKTASSPPKDLRQEALYIMNCFTFRHSTPSSKVGELLQNAFFTCSTSRSFPILSNLGIRDSKDVRHPHPDFQPFMKERAILDDALCQTKWTLIEQLPENYAVGVYTFRDVKEELESRIFDEKEMIACIGWWTKSFGVPNNQLSGKDTVADEYWKKEFSSVARFHSSSKTSPHPITLSTIKKFVDTRPRSSFAVQMDDPLPPDTIPIPFTRSLNPDQVNKALGWKHMTIVDWIRYLVSPGLEPSQDICKSHTFSEKVFTTLRTAWPSLQTSDRETIIALMQSVECIPTNQGHHKPQYAHFPEVDLFNELPVVQFVQHYSEYGIVLEALSVKRYLDWSVVKERLLSNTACSMMRLVSYLHAVRPYMVPEEFMAVKQLAIFASEGEGEARCCVHEIYRPDPLHRVLGLPVLVWGDARMIGPFGIPEVRYEYLNEFGLRQFPPLDLIIEKASSKDPPVRLSAYNFFVNHLESHYEKYNPADFSESAFLPCGKGDRPTQFGTPEEVLTSAEWEIFGFHTIHRSVPQRTWMRLKLRDRPSAAAIIKAMKERPPPSRETAKRWFDLLARKGGFASDDLAIISEMEIVPIQYAPVVGSSDGTNPDSPQLVAPRKCFYSPPDPIKAHHRAIFTYVDYNESGNSFLKMCGAKANPDCSDIVEAMIANPPGYLNKIEMYLEKYNMDKAQAQKSYLDDLRQVAAGYHSLSRDLRTKIERAPIFISFGKSRLVSDVSDGSVQTECSLRLAREILIADDLESQRLFSEHIFVTPKEEVFENFYRDHGSQSLSAHVKHVVKHGTFVSDDKDLRNKVIDRLKIFLHDQERTRLSDFQVSRWEDEVVFTVKYCKTLDISKELEFEHVRQLEEKQLVPIQEPALAGIENIQGKDTLWVKHQPDSNRQDWYDIAVALCRIIFKMHKTHDTLLLMTILDASLDDLRRRGYDVDNIRQNFENEAKGVERAAKANGGGRKQKGDGSPAPPFFSLSNLFLNWRKKKNQSGEFVQNQMDDMVTAALKMCATDPDEKQVNDNKSKGGKKQGDVKYCKSRETHLEQCIERTTNGMTVSKTPGSADPPKEELETFSSILAELGALFGLEPGKLHIFHQQHDLELMGSNRNNAIYFNLAHFKDKRALSSL